MFENPLLRLVLTPLSFLYGAVIFLRNWLYDHGYFKSIEFDFPVICIGNLSVGGTGKTSHVEYLIFLLSQHFRIAVLSRGYKRKTSGYIEIQPNSPAADGGDEPVMLKKKFPHVTVAVSEDRAMGIPQLLSDHPQLDVILLDDAFQHRSVRAGSNILLTSYEDLFTRDMILPAGSLREFKSASRRAEFIVVTKCPPQLDDRERVKIKNEIAPQKNQLIFFSYQTFGKPYMITDASVRLDLQKNNTVILFCGIASPKSLQNYLEEKVQKVYTVEFSDHHLYTRFDIEQITETFQNVEHADKLLLTTEKDAVRLQPYAKWIVEKKLPIFVLPLRVEFFSDDKKIFDEEITGYLQGIKNQKKLQSQ